ncbi:MAG TPA: hypothetical protein VLT62_04570 [Candidatus Methylomirabilis sp.]|nr:hypothetical protein [Candidatus Methylomirabilis sp.]
MNRQVDRPGKASRSSPWRPNFFRLGLVILVGLYGAVCSASPSTYRFLDRVDLVFHEAGHAIFGLFGEFIGVLGGSLMQILIPAIVVGCFFFHQQHYSAAVTLFWVAQSLFNLSVYVRDARAQALPLLGGEDALHDWHYLLGRLHLLKWDQACGNLVYLVGVAVLIGSVLGGLSYSLGEDPDAG